MDLSNLVRKWPKNPDLELMVELKYGKPAADLEYVEKLPYTVVKLSLRALRSVPEVADDNSQEQINRERLFWRLHDSSGNTGQIVGRKLIEYHLLLGHV